MWARLKCVAEWISRERGNRSWLGSIHKDSDISWGITIVDVMPAGSAKAKGKRGVGWVGRPRNLCLVLPTQACKQSPKWDPLHSLSRLSKGILSPFTFSV